ncbi:N-acetylornithine carbamoyltransferase [Candidatus Woesearchaeota archaeon]|nr:N-acetylornithine carbamoyltransferase [Candidatus Woesearchaeota archaeon]
MTIGKNFISTQDWSKNELDELLQSASDIKKSPYNNSLKNKNLVMLFFNPSLRTRVSFEVAMNQLGGSAVSLNSGQDSWKLEHVEGAVMDHSTTEHIKDAARVLSRYADAIAIRCFPSMNSWEEDRKDLVMGSFAKYATVPVINMESSMHHPCQALADIMTVKEHAGNLKGKKLVLAWSNHPRQLPTAVPNSIALIASRFGMDTVIAHPKDYELDSDVMHAVEENCRANGSTFKVVNKLDDGLKGADFVYAKSWGSAKYYGRPDSEKSVRAKLRGWKITRQNMLLTKKARFMHCLPIRRNVEADDEVIDSSDSLVYEQAENRLHVQKALLNLLIGGGS